MSDFGQTVGAMPGNIGVVVSKMGSHGPEFFARRMVEKMISVSDDAPQPIRDQAIAYRDDLYAVALYYVKEAMKSAKAEAAVFGGD